MSYIAENPKDIYRDFQIVDEGDVVADVTKFAAGFPTNPTFKYWGKNQRFKTQYNPAGFAIQSLSDENRKEIIIVKNAAKVIFDFDITDYTYNGDLSYLLELHKTDFKSRAGFFSRKPGATEYVKKFYGMVPIKTELLWPDNGQALVHATVETLVCSPQAEDTTGPTIGSGSYAPSLAASAALKASDAGNNSFTYNSVNSKTQGMKLIVSPLYQILDPDESLTIQHMRPIARDISGFVKVFKKQGADLFHADILSQTLRSMSKVIKSSPGARIDMTDVQISASDEDDYSSIKTDSNIKIYNYTAGGLTLANIP